MAEINKITGIVVGQYGEAISLTVVDKNGNAVNISSYTTSISVTIRDPLTLNSKTYSGSFVTDGTNGQIQFTPSAGDIDRPGTWEGQIKLEKASAIALTRVFTLEVDKRIGAST
jgi:hypothetical protein